MEKVLLYLKPNDFNFDVNKRIFACMVNLYTKRIPIDPIIVFNELSKDKNFFKFQGFWI
ncbi:DnaB-like helicase N-terminal domain-containing protein [Borreliella andersonii]|uniref:DnaB-like helicase N-terminal domain-containing protein n=1 Tax=Borrelia andersonii TaxID=42109 RepID=UPI003AB71FE5